VIALALDDAGLKRPLHDETAFSKIEISGKTAGKRNPPP
jgi:hypothetical protein